MGLLNIYGGLDITKGFAIFDLDGISPYEPTFWLNNMGQINKPTALTTINNTRVSTSMVQDHEGVYVTCLPEETTLDRGRREQNLATSLTTHSIAVESGRTYQISCEGVSASTVILSNATAGTLTNNGSDRLAFDTAKTATTGVLTLTVTGALISLQVQDVTGRSNTAPSEVLDPGTTEWYADTNGNSVNSGVVTAAPGTAITPVPQVLMQPQKTNAVVNSFFSELGAGGADVFAKWSETVAGTSTINQELDDLPPGFTSGLRFDIDALSSLAQVAQVKRIAIPAGGVATVSAFVKVANVSGFRFSIRVDNGAGGSLHYLAADGLSWQVGSASFIPSDLPVAWDLWQHRLPATPAGTSSMYLNQVKSTSGVSVSHRLTALQLVEGPEAGTPIKTTIAPATRDADELVITDWSNFAPLTSGLMLFAFTPSSDWAALGAEQLVYGGASANLSFRSANDGGLKATDGTSTSSILSGHTPGTEIIASVYFDAGINIFQVGYYEMDNATQHWDASPATFVTLAVDPELIVAKIIDGAVTARGLQIFTGMPAGGVDKASIEAWIEANQEAEIDKRMGK